MSSLDLLRRAVEKHSQADIARALDVNRQLVNRWLSGDRPFPPEHALYLAEWMGEPEPNHYELLAASTRHETRKRWLQKKARAVASCAVLVLALGLVSPTLEARGITSIVHNPQQYILCAFSCCAEGSSNLVRVSLWLPIACRGFLCISRFGGVSQRHSCIRSLSGSLDARRATGRTCFL